jgi:hypothetical protein
MLTGDQSNPADPLEASPVDERQNLSETRDAGPSHGSSCSPGRGFIFSYRHQRKLHESPSET